MSSLKKDIIDELHLLDVLDQWDDKDLEPHADNILKLIEKRIDSRIIKCEKMMKEGFIGKGSGWSIVQWYEEDKKEMLK